MTHQPQPKISQLIITRPTGQADQLINKIRSVIENQAGENSPIAVKHLPLLQIMSLEFDLPETSNFEAAIFISGNAANYFFSKRQLSDTKLFAVGENTALQVEKHCSQKVIFPSQMNAEGLLDLPDLKSIRGQDWLIVKGEGGRSILRQTLVERGAFVSELDVYQRKLPDLEQQQTIYKAQNQQSVWIITSAEALEHLHRILELNKTPTHQTKIIVSSDRLAIMAKQKGFLIVAQSKGAAESQLVECVRTLFKPTMSKA